MGILTKDEIIHRIANDDLIIDAHTENNVPVVEPASYDLRAGIIIWKTTENNKSEVKREDFNPALPLEEQKMVTIQPGQVLFVITREQVNMPKELCGTVYAKNEFSRSGILLFTTGHIDPGIQCPIVIRLVNLRATPFTLTLGQRIYTIVFHTIQTYKDGTLTSKENITMLKTIERTKKSAEEALDNALYDLSLLSNLVKREEFDKIAKENNFIKEDELGKAAWKWARNNALKAFGWIVAILVFLATIIGAIPSALDAWSRFTGNDIDPTVSQPKVEDEKPTSPVNSSKH